MNRIGSLTTSMTVSLALLAGCGSSSNMVGTGGTNGGGTGGAAGSAVGGGAGKANGGSTGAGGVGGASATGGATGSAGASGGLPPLTVAGNKLQDPNGKTIVLRGSSLIDIGSLYMAGGNNASGITARIDKLITSGVAGHVLRLPVYPEIDYNGGYPYCSAVPYPVGTGPTTTCAAASTLLSASDYDTKVLKPAVDYATSKGLYVIIDHHQIDNATSGTSAADATMFWNDVAPQFASYTNVFYEPFNEPIDSSASWATLKPVVQGWINTIRAHAPNNIIIVPSTSYDQHPGDAASNPPTGTNLMYTAHIYPGNWNSTFMSQLATATSKAPVFISEWGYTISTGSNVDDTTSATWGTDFQEVVDGDGASWTAWVSDNSWTPAIFVDSTLGPLTNFGMLVQTWLAAKASSDWVH